VKLSKSASAEETHLQYTGIWQDISIISLHRQLIARCPNDKKFREKINKKQIPLSEDIIHQENDN